MPTIVIQLDPLELANADADIRYALPDLLAHRSSGILVDDGYDYVQREGKPPVLIVFLQTENVAVGIPIVVSVLENERLLGNDLSKLVVAIDDGQNSRIIHPSGFQGIFHRSKWR